MNSIKVLFVAAFFEADCKKNYTMPFIDRQMESLKRRGIEIVPYSLRLYEGKMNYFREIKPLCDIIKNKKISLVHAHYLYSALPCSLKKSVPLVVSLMGTDALRDVGKGIRKKLKNFVNPILIRALSPRWDAVVVKSEKMRKSIRHPNVHIIPNGVDFAMFFPIDTIVAKKSLNFDVERPVILFGGNPEIPIKNYSLAKKVYEHVVNAVDNAIMVALTGIPHYRVPIYLNAADCVLMTSINEGSPNVVKEALACNTPVVSVNVGDVYERLKDFDTCSVCNHDAVEIAREVVRVIRNGTKENIRERLGYLDINRVADEIIEIYKDLLA